MAKVDDIVTAMRKNPKNINIQNHKGMAKAYQVRQILKAIDKLEAYDAEE